MTYNISTAARRTAVSTLMTVVLASAFPQPGFAETMPDMWKVNLAQSHFGPDVNTLFLYPASGKSTMQATDAKENSKSRTLVVISNRKIYLATDETTNDASSGKAFKADGYSRWKDMKLVQIGDYVRPSRCGFYVGCRSGQSDNRMVLRFNAAKGVDVAEQMSNTVVINAR